MIINVVPPNSEVPGMLAALRDGITVAWTSLEIAIVKAAKVNGTPRTQ